MDQKRTPLRPGMTAIAAVLALSSTPLFAQAAEAPAATEAPVVIAPPPPVVMAAPVAVQAAPVAASAMPAPVITPAPAPSIVQTSAPKPVVRAKPVTITTPKAVAPTAAVRTAVPETAPAMAIAAPAPVAALPEPVVAKPAPVVARNDVTQSAISDDTLPIAAGAGLLVLALGGGAWAFSRRRRREDEVVYGTETVFTTAEPMPSTAAQMAYAAPAAPIVFGEMSMDGPVTAIPAGFDMARYGRHTRAAYQGPTSDNPSLSLRRRLKRANFYDQREREAASVGEQPVASPYASADRPVPAMAPRQTDHVTTRMPRAPRPAFRPVFSS